MKTLSVRMPWAWLIVHGYKPIENRTWASAYRGPLLIHAGQTMTRGDYEACVLFCSGLPVGVLPHDFLFPTFAELRSQCGGTIGQVNMVDCVSQSTNPWFVGEHGFVLAEPEVIPFCPCKGRLGIFEL